MNCITCFLFVFFALSHISCISYTVAEVTLISNHNVKIEKMLPKLVKGESCGGLMGKPALSEALEIALLSAGQQYNLLVNSIIESKAGCVSIRGLAVQNN